LVCSSDPLGKKRRYHAAQHIAKANPAKSRHPNATKLIRNIVSALSIEKADVILLQTIKQAYTPDSLWLVLGVCAWFVFLLVVLAGVFYARFFTSPDGAPPKLRQKIYELTVDNRRCHLSSRQGRIFDGPNISNGIAKWWPCIPIELKMVLTNVKNTSV
jgi:hypothetical protein